MKSTPNEDAIPKTFTIGKWEAHPFTLNTAILLERINSPFMRQMSDPVSGKVIAAEVPTITEVAQALYIILNWHKPTVHEIVADEGKFNNEVADLASQITMREFANITGQLNDMMGSLNEAVTESGLPQSDGKKEETGSSDS